MPRLLQPSSLLDLSLRAVGPLFSNMCKYIQNNYGLWSNPVCRNFMYSVRDQFSSEIPVELLTLIYKEYSSSHLFANIDPRIFISMFVNKNMKELHIGETHRNDLNLYNDLIFWASILCPVNRIVYLNLSNICSKNILFIIGDTCPNLEYIDISRSDWPNYQISDNDIKFLDKCVKLKVIILAKEVQTLFNERVTKTGVSYLLKSLPNLLNFECNAMGPAILEVLGEVKSLQLLRATFFQPLASHIIGVSVLCSNLKELYLHFLFFVLDNTDITDIYDAIKCSSLRVSVLELVHFTVNESLFDMLSVKGKYLKHFTLFVDQLTTELVYAIGRNCIDLVCLDLREYRSTENIFRNNSDPEMFSKLRGLILHVQKSRSCSAILPIVLPHAKVIKKVEIRAEYISAFCDNDEVMKEILRMNPMTHLTEFNSCCNLSMETILYFFYCPQMTKISFLKISSMPPDILDILVREISENNLDISVHFYELIEQGI